MEQGWVREEREIGLERHKSLPAPALCVEESKGNFLCGLHARPWAVTTAGCRSISELSWKLTSQDHFAEPWVMRLGVASLTVEGMSLPGSGDGRVKGQKLNNWRVTMKKGQGLGRDPVSGLTDGATAMLIFTKWAAFLLQFTCV